MIDRNLRIVFMGTPSFAVPSLQFLIEAGYPVVGVVTAPDKLGGRGMKQLISSPIKQFALDYNLPLLQPTNLKSKSFHEALRGLKADLQVVVAFRMLPESVWNMPTKGTMNLHGSLLPAYRGAAPIHWAIIRGEVETGVTTFLLEHEIDSGKILLQRKTPIQHEDDTGSLHDRMMHLGAGLVVASADLICEGSFITKTQEEGKISLAPKIHHDDGHILWQKPVKEIHNLIRGMSPFPGAWIQLDGQECKLWKSKIHYTPSDKAPGEIWVEQKALFIQGEDGILEILEIQMAGKKKMGIQDFINGYKITDLSAT